MKKLSPNALGIAIGILWAAYVLFCGITASFAGGSHSLMQSRHSTSDTALPFLGQSSDRFGVS
jgi:hypothetical protein